MLIELLQNEENLTETEQELSRYILAHLDTVTEMTVRQLADAAFVSPPMVSRLCRKLGTKGWNDFKVRLATECAEAYQAMMDVDSNFPVAAGDSLRQIADKIAQLSIQHILAAKDNLDFAVIHQAIEAICKRRIIDIYGEGMSAVSGAEFSEKMLRIGYMTAIFRDYTTQYYHASASTDAHFAIVISHSGLSGSIIRIIQILSRRKVPVLLITGNHLSPMVKYADYVCYIHSAEELDMQQKIERFGVQTVIHYILDVIYAGTFSQNYHKNRKLLQEQAKKEPYDF